MKHLVYQCWVTAAMLVICSVARAQWQQVPQENPQDIEHFIDQQSVRQTGPMSIYRQVKVLSQGSALKQQSIESTVSLHEYDCMNAKLRILQTTAYSKPWGEGTSMALKQSPSTGQWHDLPRDALGQTVFDTLCPSGQDE